VLTLVKFLVPRREMQRMVMKLICTSLNRKSTVVWACFVCLWPFLSEIAPGAEVDQRTLAAVSQSSPWIPAVSLDFLGDLTRDVVKASRVAPGHGVGDSPTNAFDFELLMPGGHGGYPAFWIRDFSMSLDCGFIGATEISNHLQLIARCQNGPNPRRLRHGLLIPPFAIPDHINFDGQPVFYPGTYSCGDDQGSGAYGILPPVDDHYEFVHIAYCLYRAATNAAFLRQDVGAMPMFDRLVAAFDAPRIDAPTGLVSTGAAERAVGFGFCDAIYLTGRLLFPSLLRYRAAGELAEMCEAVGRDEQARAYRMVQRIISKNLSFTFDGGNRTRGWLLAATEVGRQPDVWGTLYALHLGAVEGEPARRALTAVMDAVRSQTITFKSAVRHLPTDFDYSRTSAWERTAGVAVNTYQNGAYWHTPTGWLIEAVGRREPRLAMKLLQEYVSHLRQEDYRLGHGHEAPWECFGPGPYAQNGVYMTSVTVPFSVLKTAASPGH
jgi:hypothetical protein